MKHIIALLAAFTLVGCESKPPEPKNQKPVPSSPLPGADNQKVDAPKGNDRPARTARAPAAMAEISWSKPEAWKQVDNPSRMRKATYKIAKAEGDAEDAEMSVTQVGGSVDANIKRWEGQFDGTPQAKTTESEVNGLKVTVVEIEGKFKSGGGPMMGGSGEPKDGWAMLAAIVHTTPAHFFKMTGPQKTVKGSRADFDVLVGSFAPKK